MKDHLTGQLFIRDDIPVRQLDAKYKRIMRQLAARHAALATQTVGQCWWQRGHGLMRRWNVQFLLEKLLLRGA